MEDFFEESITTDTVNQMVNDGVRKWLDIHFEPILKNIYRRLETLEKDFNASPLNSLTESNALFLSEIRPVLEHIRDYEKKIHKEWSEINKKWETFQKEKK